MNFCPNCGNNLQSSFNFCGSCGASIKAEWPSEATIQESSHVDNAESASAQFHPVRPTDEISAGTQAKPAADQLYEKQLVGEKYSYYTQKWHEINPDQGRIISLNWPALLFGTMWYAYRKMHFAWLIQFAIIIFFSLLELKFGEQKMFFVGQLALQACLGLIGNYLYMIHVRKIAKEISELSIPDIIKIEIGKRGGTSLSHVFGLFFAAFAFQALVWIALDI